MRHLTMATTWLKEIDPPAPSNSFQQGVMTSPLYSGSRFEGSQKSKGNCYDVEVILQVIVWINFLKFREKHCPAVSAFWGGQKDEAVPLL